MWWGRGNGQGQRKPTQSPIHNATGMQCATRLACQGGKYVGPPNCGCVHAHVRTAGVVCHVHRSSIPSRTWRVGMGDTWLTGLQ